MYTRVSDQNMGSILCISLECNAVSMAGHRYERPIFTDVAEKI
jgi:hypothetical protein